MDPLTHFHSKKRILFYITKEVLEPEFETLKKTNKQTNKKQNKKKKQTNKQNTKNNDKI